MDAPANVSEPLRSAELLYDEALDILLLHPDEPNYRQAAFDAGRAYTALLPHGEVANFDQAALDNDLKAAAIKRSLRS